MEREILLVEEETIVNEKSKKLSYPLWNYLVEEKVKTIKNIQTK